MTTSHTAVIPTALGQSSITASRLAWGMWRLGHGDPMHADRLVRTALEIGITLFDTADVYGASGPGGFGSSELVLGQVIKSSPSLRESMVIATKGGIRPGVPYDSSATYITKALEDSLRRMNIEIIDLYQIHRRDLLVHPHELARCLEDMVSSGKIRAIGVSNYSYYECETLQGYLNKSILSVQFEFSPLSCAALFDGRIDEAMRTQKVVLAWSPLGGGRLLEKGSQSETVFAEFGKSHGVDAATAALSWIMAHPAKIIPIIGSQTPDRLRSSVEALKIVWSRQEWYSVLQSCTGSALP